jgi:hypothetical protein
MIKRTTVREVPAPPSPSPAPLRLRGWSAHEERISIRRSEEESIENTPTNTPAGGRDPKLSGGKGGKGGDEATVEMLRKVG